MKKSLTRRLTDFKKWCRWSDSNRHAAKAQDFESCVSTISPHRHIKYFTIKLSFLQANKFVSITIEKRSKILYNKLVLKLINFIEVENE